MTFFANSGIRFPSVEDLTRGAGQAAMDGASHIWKLLSILEGGDRAVESGKVNLEGERALSISLLQRAANDYADVAKSIDPNATDYLSGADVDIAALGYDSWFGDIRPPLKFSDQKISLPNAYRELAQRLLHLATLLESLLLSSGEVSKAPMVFQIMRHWELAAGLARAVAVINQRR